MLKLIKGLHFSLLISFFILSGVSKCWSNGMETAHELQEAFIKVSDKVGPAVVSISTLKVRSGIFSGDPYLDEFLRQFFGTPSEPERLRTGLGSGVIIDEEGFILTNEHVVANADEIEVRLSDGRKFLGKVTGVDSRLDLAIVKIESQEELPVAELGDSDKVKTGEWVIAIGNPFGHLLADPQPTLTVGVVSAQHRALPNVLSRGTYYGDLIQTDAAINAGNSGGPLVNIEGQVIGINTAILSPSGASAGLGFAIPVNLAKVVLNSLKRGEEPTYGWVGIWIQPITDEVAEELGLKDKRGVLIYRVEPRSPAADAGLKPGDVIHSLNNEKIADSRDLIRRILRLHPGDKINIMFIRKGESKSADVIIGERQGDGQGRRKAESIKTETVEWRGMVVQEVPQEIKEEWGLTDGIYVYKVNPGSSAFRSGIREGDVIDEMNKKPVQNLRQFFKVIKSAKEHVLLHTQRGYFVVK